MREIGERVLRREHGDGAVLSRRHDDVRDALLHFQTDKDAGRVELDLLQLIHAEAIVHVSTRYDALSHTPLQLLFDLLARETVVEIFGQLGLVLDQSEEIPDRQLAPVRNVEGNADMEGVEVDGIHRERVGERDLPLGRPRRNAVRI